MALTGQSLPFDFPMPPKRLVYARPEPSCCSQEAAWSSDNEPKLVETEYRHSQHLADLFEDGRASSTQIAGRRKIMSSQLLPATESTRPRSSLRRSADSALQHTRLETFRCRRQPQGNLIPLERGSHIPRRVTGLRPSPVPKYPRRDASLPLLGFQEATSPPVSPLQAFSVGVAPSPSIEGVLRTTQITVSKEPLAPLDSPSDHTIARTSDPEDSDATCVDTPFSATFAGLNLDSPLGCAALDLSWDWLPSPSDDLQKPLLSHARPISPKDKEGCNSKSNLKSPRLHFRSSGGTKSLRQGIPQAFKDAAFRSGSRAGTPTSPAKCSDQSDEDGLTGFPAGEASPVDDVTRSGWYPSDSEDDGGAKGKKFSLSFGKGSLKKSWLRSMQGLRKASA